MDILSKPTVKKIKLMMKDGVSPIVISVQHCTSSSSQCNKEKQIKGIKTIKEEIKSIEQAGHHGSCL